LYKNKNDCKEVPSTTVVEVTVVEDLVGNAHSLSIEGCNTTGRESPLGRRRMVTVWQTLKEVNAPVHLLCKVTIWSDMEYF
jgi:hypothetical protein